MELSLCGQCEKARDGQKGYEDGRFGKADVTRRDMAVIIYRAMVNLKLVEGLDSVKTEGLFVDQNAIAPYALNSVIMLKNISLVSGNDQQGVSAGEQCHKSRSGSADEQSVKL